MSMSIHEHEHLGPPGHCTHVLISLSITTEAFTGKLMSMSMSMSMREVFLMSMSMSIREVYPPAQRHDDGPRDH